jgi:hypothetical protein
MKDICGNDITVTIVENGIQQPSDNKWFAVYIRW